MRILIITEYIIGSFIFIIWLSNSTLLINSICLDLILFSKKLDKNDFIFEFDGGIMTLKGNNSCIFGLKLSKEVIYNKGKCMLCFSSEDTLKFHPGDLIVEGGVIVNGNPYGISPVKFAKVTNVTPLIINKDNSL